MNWARKRQTLYLTVIGIIALSIVAGLYLTYKPLPSCFDKKQNQDELGVDCGGVCALACKKEVSAVRVIWAKPLPVGDGVYDVAALVENQNATLGVRKINYTVRLFDNKNLLVTTKTGQTFLNPNERFVLFEPGLAAGKRNVTRAFVDFESGPVWERIGKALPEISVQEKNFENGAIPKLTVKIANKTVAPINNLRFSAVLSNGEQNAIGASATVLDEVAGSQVAEIYFTWPKEFSSLPAIIDIYPRINVFELAR